ncbi:PREDICTED: disease resistance protein At4g27190 isoform X2 [Theobroma cacao]|uniref:Disease resistance protein At4g27190 isoform X2 n=1 Tax=Theobroma cacao TaxID=3641 RepID=A0AB32VDV5_THECC|nr:PREDICTED: disease resistance protein At4g27190 isoform X2 [Theobroma cacao]
MQQSVLKASGSGLTQLREEEEWAGKGVLFMNDNKASELHPSPNCPSPIALYLQGNYELTAIPPFFFRRMALLQVLDLSHTSIKCLPKSLPRLVALKKLLLRRCQLFMELSPQVAKLSNLQELDLDETQIMDLPREIGKLLNLRHLRVSFYLICGKKKSKSNILIHPETISDLSLLTELSIDVNPTDKRWDDSVEAVVKEVCNSETLTTLSLYLPKFQLLDNISSLYPSLSGFRFTVGHHKRRIISRVPHEVEAEFRNWDKCLKFVNGENIPIEIKDVLKYSTSFFLDHHATAMNLSEFGIENMKRLKFCLLVDCNKMETIIDGERRYEGNEDDLSESDPSPVENVLESLEYLIIYYMENLESIWRGPNRYGCMSKLKFLALHTCPQLINIFSHTLLGNFVNLEEFILEDCPLVTSLVSHASVKPMVSDKFLPSLKRLLLLYLPELVSISNGLLIAPKLETIGFYNCPKLKSISKMELSSKTLKIIKGELQWWEDMKWNEAEWGNRPDYLMRIFSPIDKEKDVMNQLAEDRDLFEVTMQNEGQQLDDEKLIEVSTQDHGGRWSDYTEERITGADVTKSISSVCILPSTPWTEAPKQAWSFSPDENKRLEDDYFDLASETSEADDIVDEPKAKRWNCTENENKGVIRFASKVATGDRTEFQVKRNVDILDDGYKWRNHRTKLKGYPYSS